MDNLVVDWCESESEDRKTSYGT